MVGEAVGVEPGGEGRASLAHLVLVKDLLEGETAAKSVALGGLGGAGESGVAGLDVGDGLAQVVKHGREIGLELLLGLAELLDFGQFVVEEDTDEAVEISGARHVNPHGLLSVLEEDGSEGVLEDDVVAGVAPVELGLDFGIKVVVAVLRLPVAAGHAEGVADGAVGPVAQWSVEFVDEGELLAVLAAVGVEADGEGAADTLLVVGATEVDEALLLFVVTLYVGVRRHSRFTIHLQCWDLDYPEPLFSLGFVRRE